jgi:hypothetical protein
MQRFFEHNVLMIGLPGAVDKVLKSVKNKKATLWVAFTSYGYRPAKRIGLASSSPS